MILKKIFVVIKNKPASILRLLNIGVSTLFVVYLISSLDVESFGFYSFYITIVKFLPYVLCLNIPEYLFKSIPKAESDLKVNEYLKIQLPFFLYSILFALINITLLVLGIYDFDLFWVVNVCILSVNLRIYNSFLIFDEKIIKFSAVDLLVNVTWMIHLLLVDFDLKTIFELRFIYGTLLFLCFFITEQGMQQKLRHIFVEGFLTNKICLNRKIIKFGVVTLPSILLVMSLEIIDRWLLTLFSGTLDLGYLGFSMMPANIIFGFITMVHVSAKLKGISANAVLSSDKKLVLIRDFNKEISKILSFTLFLSTACYVTFYIITYFFFYEKYFSIAHNFWINIILSVLMVSAYYLRFCLINNFRSYMNYIYALGLFLNVVLNILIIPYLGYLAVLISSCISFLIICFLCLIKVKTNVEQG